MFICLKSFLSLRFTGPHFATRTLENIRGCNVSEGMPRQLISARQLRMASEVELLIMNMARRHYSIMDYKRIESSFDLDDITMDLKAL